MSSRKHKAPEDFNTPDSSKSSKTSHNSNSTPNTPQSDYTGAHEFQTPPPAMNCNISNYQIATPPSRVHHGQYYPPIDPRQYVNPYQTPLQYSYSPVLTNYQQMSQTGYFSQSSSQSPNFVHYNCMPEPNPSQTEPQFVPNTQTQSQNEEVQEVDASGEPKTSGGRGPKFSTTEDVLLTELWLKYSQDPITGTSQKKEKFWAKILVEFEAANLGKERLVKGLQNRWNGVRDSLHKFCAIHSRNMARAASGKNESDVLVQSFGDYHSKHKTPFKHTECWDVVKDHGRWKSAFQELGQQEERKRAQKNVTNEIRGSSDDEEEIVPIYQASGEPMTQRLDGRDTAKRKARAAKQAQTTINRQAEAMEKYMQKQDERAAAYRMEKEKSEEKRMAMLAKQEERMERLAQAASNIAAIKEKQERRKQMDSIRKMLAELDHTSGNDEETQRRQFRTKRRLQKQLDILVSQMIAENGTDDEFDDDD